MGFGSVLCNTWVLKTGSTALYINRFAFSETRYFSNFHLCLWRPKNVSGVSALNKGRNVLQPFQHVFVHWAKKLRQHDIDTRRRWVGPVPAEFLWCSSSWDLCFNCWLLQPSRRRICSTDRCLEQADAQEIRCKHTALCQKSLPSFISIFQFKEKPAFSYLSGFQFPVFLHNDVIITSQICARTALFLLSLFQKWAYKSLLSILTFLGVETCTFSWKIVLTERDI